MRSSVHEEEFTAHDSMAVRCAEAEFSEAPWFVCWPRCEQRAFRFELSVKVVDTYNVPVSEVGVVCEFTRWSLVGAFPEHDSESIARQETPTSGVDRILAEAEDVDIVARGNLKISDRQYAAGIDYFRHARVSPGSGYNDGVGDALRSAAVSSE